MLLSEVARLYYLEDFTQERISRRIGVSRSNVSRMLKEARERGLVEIRVRSPLSTASGLQRDLGDKLGLKDCLVLSASGSGDVGAGISKLAGRYLQENIADGSIVGAGWSSAVYGVAGSGSLREKKDVAVAQLMGSIGDAIPELNGVYITGRMADALGARAHYLHAPMLVANTAVRDGLLRDRHIRRTLEVARQADIAVVGIGAINRDSGQYRAGYLDDTDLDYIRKQGAVGDVCGCYFARDGSACPLEMNERTIALSAEHLKNIPVRLGVSYSVKKALANIGAVRSGLVNVLVTDEEAATEMLSILDSESP